jgi:transcriptional regulator with XRE-family HTH domain
MKPYVRIRAARIKKGLTQIKLARLAGVSQSYLSEIENNKKSPTLRQLCKIADALNIEPDKLWFIIYD